MTQQDVIDYLLQDGNNCSIYKIKTKEDGDYFWIRNSVTGKLKIVFPVRNEEYSPASVCDACLELDVVVPEYAQEICEAMRALRKI